jgi:hypothetical protein
LRVQEQDIVAEALITMTRVLGWGTFIASKSVCAPLSAEYRFVRRYLERRPQAPLSLRQVDPLIRELTEYRDLIQQRIHFEETNP